jgi:lipoprotein-anchoring transpeptidase ErfK/SrfK
MRHSDSTALLRCVHKRRASLRLLLTLVLFVGAVAPVSAHSPGAHEAPALQELATPSWADAPPVEYEINRTGRVQVETPLSVYPTDNPAAAYARLGAGTSVEITGSLIGDDGQQWYRTADGAYLTANAVVFPNAPSVPAMAITMAPLRDYAYNWIDVDLNLPATVTAYEGDTPVRTMYTIIGRGPLATPTGNFSIIRRVANETMDSSTIGIPRDGPGGYYLTDVLFTQYFLPAGYSIHYNYWSSNWGYPGSHGCLGLSYGDAAFMWDFADIGTPLSIHY